jgi:hypothetical protein
MRTTALILAFCGFTALEALAPMRAHAAPVLVPQVSEPAIQPVWYDRWGYWHPPHYGYGYGPPRPYWRHRRWECVRWGHC